MTIKVGGVVKRVSGKVSIVTAVVAVSSLALTSLANASGTGQRAFSSRQTNAVTATKVKYDPTLYNELPASIKRSKVVYVVQAPNEPFTVVGSNNHLTGIAPSLSQYFSTLFGVKFKSVLADGIPAAQLGVTSGRYQIAYGPYVDNAAGEKDFNVVDDVNALQGYLHLKKDPVNNILDFCGKIVASLSGAAPTIALGKELAAKCQAAGKPAETMKYFATTQEDVLAVQDGRAFAAQFAGFTGDYYDIVNHNFATYVVPGSVVSGIIAGGFVGKNFGGLGRAYYQATEILDRDGILGKVFTQWGITSNTGILLKTVRYNDERANNSAPGGS